MTTDAKLHPFEAANLGAAPYRIIGWDREVGPRLLPDGTQFGAPGQPMGTCDYCGNGIAICVRVLASDGKRFTVGCDCAEKCDMDVRSVRRAVRSEAVRKAQCERQRRIIAAHEAELQAQRERNGGLTDREVEQQEAEARAAVAAQANAGILLLLDDAPSSPFVESVCRDLQRHPISELSDRCLSILSDIVGKSAGRRNSKAYNAACERFWQQVDAAGQ